MDYRIDELEAISVIGQETRLTNYQCRNLDISIKFWKQFNAALKKAYLAQGGNWSKYAFMYKRDGIFYYYCAIPRRTTVPDDFMIKEIPPQKYLVVEHIGPMENIYNTYSNIYNVILPECKYVPDQTRFLHFERYDSRFQWNRNDSVIEIWVPVQSSAGS